MKRLFRLLIALTILSIAISSIKPTASAQMKPRSKHASIPTLSQRVKNLHDLLAEQWEYTLRTSPEFASILGDKRYYDRLSDFSQAAIDRDLRQARRFLQNFEAIDPTGFSTQEQLNRELMLRNLRQQLEAAQFKEWEMPVSQFGGIHIDSPQLVVLDGEHYA